MPAPAIRHAAGVICTVAATLMLTACASMTTLNDGRKSNLTPEHVALRLGLQLQAATSPVTLSYRPVPVCSYRESATPPGSVQRIENRVVVRMRPVADKIQVVLIRNGGDPESALIGHNGHAYDINLDSGLKQGRRTTTETSQADAREYVSQLRSRIAVPKDLSTVNDLTLYFPEFSVVPIRAGEAAATVYTGDRRPWAYYRFMGLTIFRGTQAAVLDMERVIPGAESLGPVLVGFGVVDTRTLVPILVVTGGGSNLRLERTGCEN